MTDVIHPSTIPPAPVPVPVVEPPPESMRGLDPVRIIETIRALGVRIDERFPDRGLSRVARQQLNVAESTVAHVEWVRRPILWVRATAAAVVVLLVALLAGIALRINLSAETIALPDLLQMVEAAINELIFLGAAVVFLATVEGRIKRQKALNALRELRALAHIVDMHQLTKDPDRAVEGGATRTPSSPAATMTRPELARYLDYCSEMLALNSKLAALYAQNLHDPVVLAAVDEVETLTTGLCAKIWQKLVILNERGMSAGG
ncbi:MAG TPA: hypothetical protein VE871_19130 [Longimicrobium sp.]|nr:hypothetical protein [Longimicrobium sp.]